MIATTVRTVFAQPDPEATATGGGMLEVRYPAAAEVLAEAATGSEPPV